MTQADAAMYAAKAEGKDRHAVYEPQMPTRTWTELEAMKREIYGALSRFPSVTLPD